jgi:very-short-patch-repair endonuclease
LIFLSNSPPFLKGGLGRIFTKEQHNASKQFNENTARLLRKNMTDAENMLWQRIRRKQIFGLQFYRQRTMVSYIVDFYCPKAKLIIEVDGGQHFQAENKLKDSKRDSHLSELGFLVLRFDNFQVSRNIEAVAEEIYRVARLLLRELNPS